MGRQTKAQLARKGKPRERAKPKPQKQTTEKKALPYGVRDVMLRDYQPVGQAKPTGMTPDGKKMLASGRLKKVLDLLQQNPQPILTQLKEIGINAIPVRTPNAINEFPDGVVLMLEEVKRADAAIAQRGTLYDQIYAETELKP